MLTGEPRSGKTMVADYLAKKYGTATIRVSKLIEEYAQAAGVTLTDRQSFLAAFRQLKAEKGNDTVANAVLSNPSNRKSVDGIRVPADVIRIRRSAPSILIALVCPAAIRFERAQNVGSPIDASTFEEFVADDRAESGSMDPELQNLSRVMVMADHHIDSSRPPGSVFADVDLVVEKELIQ